LFEVAEQICGSNRGAGFSRKNKSPMRRSAFSFNVRASLRGEPAKSAALIFAYAAVSLLPIAAGLAAPGTGGKESGEVAGFLCLVVAIAGGVLMVRSAGPDLISCLAFGAGVVSALYLSESFPFFPLVVWSLFVAIAGELRNRGTFAEGAHKAFLLATVCCAPALLVEYSKYSEFTQFRFGVAIVIAAGAGLIIAGLHFVVSAHKGNPRGDGKVLESSASASFSDVGESQ